MTPAQRRAARARSGWEVPGPMPPGEAGQADLAPAPGESLSALCGHWRIFQPERGHRWSTDDLLAAWYLVEEGGRSPSPPERVLELGAGLGTVALLLAWRLPQVRVIGYELQEERRRMALRSARYNGVAGRVELRAGDLRALRGGPEWWDWIVGTPPYWDPATGVLSQDTGQDACRFTLTAGVEDYTRAASSCLSEGGKLVLVFDGRQSARLRAAAREAGLGCVRRRPVIGREGDGPLLELSVWAKGQGAGEEEAPLLLRHRDGRRSDEHRLIREAMGLPPGSS